MHWPGMSYTEFNNTSRYVIIPLSLILLASFYYRLEFNPVELARFISGTAALIAPFGTGVYALLKREVPDRFNRLVFALSASYVLSTVFFFLFAVLGYQPLFYVLQITVLGWGLFRLIRQRHLSPSEVSADKGRVWVWLLILVIAASLHVNIPYKKALAYSPETGSYTYLLYADHLYHAGQSYELARNTPPKQQSIRAGSPERAYHNFPQITTMLISRYTGQGDMLRVHIVYHYTIIDILLSLLLFGLGRIFSGSKWGGYILLSLMYIGAFAWPNLGSISAKHFYFTFFPHITSGLYPVMGGSPQMYSGLVITYVILMGIAIISKASYKNTYPTALIIVTSLLVASTMKFRVHVFLVMLPGFLLIMVYLWFKHKERIFIISGCLALGVSLLMYLEIKAPYYLEGTTNIYLGYNYLSNITYALPFSSDVLYWLKGIIHNATAFLWTWQIVSVTAWTVLNIIGIPLMLVSFIYVSSRAAQREFLPLTMLLCWLVVTSWLGALFLTMDYDTYSVPGQLLFHTRWYLFPLYSFVLWKIYLKAKERWNLSENAGLSLGLIFLTICFIIQTIAPYGPHKGLGVNWVYDRNEWAMLNYIRDHTPRDSVILYNGYLETKKGTIPGFTGRASYLSLPGNPVDVLAMTKNAGDDRAKLIKELYSATDGDSFCKRLSEMPITHIIDSKNQTILAREHNCLQEVWSSPKRELIVWQSDAPRQD